MKKRVYTQEFKSEAVRLSYQRENIKELADELGIAVQRIYKWRRDTKSGLATNKVTVDQDQNQEIKRLQRELKDKDLELEILKKAVHIFSKSGGKSINL